MDVSQGIIKNARWPDHGASPPSAKQAEPASPSSCSPPDAAAAAGDAEATRRAEDEVDDEQVERFYALLANIRAMRGMFGGATTGKRKRPREAEPPWRPAFRMEDFDTEEVVSDHAGDAGARCGAGRRRKLIKRGGEWRLPEGSEKDAGDEDEDRDEAGVVLDRDGPGRDAARGCVDQLDSSL